MNGDNIGLLLWLEVCLVVWMLYKLVCENLANMLMIYA